MATEPPDEEPARPRETAINLAPKGRQSLSRLRRELSDEELASPAVQRLLVEELETLEKEKAELLGYRDRFHAADKEVAILQEQKARSLAGEIISTACLDVGG